MDHFVEIIKALAWPVTVIWIGYFFKNELRGIFNRVSAVKYQDIEVSLDKQLSNAEAQTSTIREEKISNSQELISTKEQLFRLAEISPKAAIVEAWSLIEMSAKRSNLVSGATIQRVSTKQIMDYLSSSGKFSLDDINLIESLRKIRNQASHLPEFAISQDEAERYLELATLAAQAIEAKNKI